MKPFKSINCADCTSCHQSIFSHAGPGALDEVSANKVMNTYKRGKDLFTQGNPATGVFCISSGKIKVSKIGHNGKETIVRLAGPGDILGDNSLTDQSNFTSTATMLEDSVICFIDKKYLTKKLEKNSSISLRMLSKLSRDMEVLELRQSALPNKTAKERLVDLLIYLRKNFSVKEGNRIKLDIRLSREEMASLTGTAQETVIRMITDLRQLGILEQEGKVLYILNEEKLNHMQK